MKFIKKPQTPLENSQTESDLLLLKEYRIGGLKTVKHIVPGMTSDDYEYRGQLLSASVAFYREVLDINYFYLDV